MLRSGLLLGLLLVLAGCKINFRGSGSSRYYKRKGSIQYTANPSDKRVYKEFQNWANRQVEEMNFEVKLDQSGARVGIETAHNSNDVMSRAVEHTSITFKSIDSNSKIEIPNINNMDIILDGLDSRIAALPNDNEVLNIFLELDSDFSKRVVDNPIESKNDATITEDNEDNASQDGQDTGKIIAKNRNIKLVLSTISSLKNWKNDKFIDAVESFAKSCNIFAAGGDKKVATKNLSLGIMSDWYDVCKKINNLKKGDNANAREFFEKYFVPVKVYQGKRSSYTDTGIFTGYYELDLEGSRRKTSVYRYPIYAMPAECKDRACATRDEIYKGALSRRKLELFWTKSYFDIYMLQIQGSGVVLLEDGGYERVGFGGTNKGAGYNVFAYMKRRCIPNCSATLAELREWFDSNERQGMSILAKSDSYVFFRQLEHRIGGAIGAQGVPLTPTRSIAVDNEMIPYGVPIWLTTRIAIKANDGRWKTIHRMLVAQDTGDAIQGGVRGDIFYGHGPKARYLAEKQKFSGSYYIFIPKNVLRKVAAL